jgi:hypothetical protein
VVLPFTLEGWRRLALIAHSATLPGFVPTAAYRARVDGVPSSPCLMLREFGARLQKGDSPGARTCVVMDDAAELFGTRKIRVRIDERIG